MKKSLLIGISRYRYSSLHSLDGVYHDIENISNTIKKFYPSTEISVLLDKDGFTSPTKGNIINAFKNIYNNVDEGDKIFIFYSGHGSNVPSTEKDEYDKNYDQAMNVLHNSIIVDNEINDLIVDKKPKGVITYVIMDCCHSGDILDLNYKLVNGKFVKIRNSNDTTDGNIILISGCSAFQSTSDGPGGGAFTNRLIEIINKTDNNMTYSGLHEELEHKLEYLKTYFGMTQEPQVFSNKLIDPNQKIF